MINYISEPIAKIAGGLKDKIVSIFNTSTPKQTVYGRGKKLMIRDIWTLYGTEEEKKEKMKLEKKKKLMIHQLKME